MADLLCRGRYDTVPWPSQTVPTISHNNETTGGDVWNYNAWAVTCNLTYITLSPLQTVSTPSLGPAWGDLFWNPNGVRVGCFLNIPWGPYFHEFNSDWFDDGPVEGPGRCWWGFDAGTFNQPYVFDPVWDFSTETEGSYIGKLF